LSHLCFLILLAAATFRLDEKAYPISYNTSEVLQFRHSEAEYDSEVNIMLKATFRPENILMTRVQICLMFWILGKSLQVRLFTAKRDGGRVSYFFAQGSAVKTSPTFC